MRRLAAAALALALGLGACQYPDDVEGTLDRVEGGTLRVGVIEDRPWLDLSGPEPAGVEPELVSELAERIDADIERGMRSELRDRPASARESPAF